MGNVFISTIIVTITTKTTNVYHVNAGFVLNESYEGVYSENCLYGTPTTCYKCRDSYIKNKNECVLDDKCEYSDGSICIKCNTGNVYNKCENCAAHCYLFENEKCLICNDIFLLNNENVCVEVENKISNGILTVRCNDTFYIANRICNNCTSKYEHSIKLCIYCKQ
ncbi:hypothetical protein EIN_342900 [Entamoeba invadens IP1]|uniref:CXXC-rich protein n=1 Tax=Entamoeba invadens IP1 TaxID=370355 RepID=A0A0A1TV47_ENTIV|nr:hypothetical protein EIN_342900 [Entamoeba invadens IP1]ELP84145.1 hypothetical protein EIN_342900 [Entamoeba invadens IP1]|eukprot:XP_004183491.1 hypothetical protein EIN_342900 [Entamoeba invadens IP1]